MVEGVGGVVGGFVSLFPSLKPFSHSLPETVDEGEKKEEDGERGRKMEDGGKRGKWRGEKERRLTIMVGLFPHPKSWVKGIWRGGTVIGIKITERKGRRIKRARVGFETSHG